MDHQGILVSKNAVILGILGFALPIAVPSWAYAQSTRVFEKVATEAVENSVRFLSRSGDGQAAKVAQIIRGFPVHASVRSALKGLRMPEGVALPSYAITRRDDILLNHLRRAKPFGMKLITPVGFTKNTALFIARAQTAKSVYSGFAYERGVYVTKHLRLKNSAPGTDELLAKLDSFSLEILAVGGSETKALFGAFEEAAIAASKVSGKEADVIAKLSAMEVPAHFKDLNQILQLRKDVPELFESGNSFYAYNNTTLGLRVTKYHEKLPTIAANTWAMSNGTGQLARQGINEAPYTALVQKIIPYKDRIMVLDQALSVHPQTGKWHLSPVAFRVSKPFDPVVGELIWISGKREATQIVEEVIPGSSHYLKLMKGTDAKLHGVYFEWKAKAANEAQKSSTQFQLETLQKALNDIKS